MRGRPGRIRRGAVAVAVVVFAAGLISAPASTAPSRRGAGDPTVPDALADRYLAVRPSLGPVTVVDIDGESSDRKLLAATLQGIVNRSEVRIYLLGARTDGSDQRWLADYQARGLIDVVATVDLDTAIHTFRSEVAGYVKATASEPWTINTATSAAGAEGGVVATEATAALLDGEGIPKLADHRGRWANAVDAYRDAAAELRSELAYGGVAIQKPDGHAPRDLFVQQGVFVLYTRPAAADYDPVYDLIETFPTHRPVYGYISDTGSEEVEAIVRLSQTGRYLVPTDTTANLSFHQAVGGEQRVKPEVADRVEVAPCTTDTVNVVLSFSDGDNLVIPEGYYPGSDHWNSPQRGTLPIGWGLSPAASVLMPAIYDTYVGGTTDADEIVDIMGLGYAIPSLMPDGASFVADNMRIRSALGLRSHWALDALLSEPDAEGWSDVVAAAAETGTPPDGMLLNYETWPGPGFFHAASLPVLASRVAGYEKDAASIASQIQALVDGPESDRSLVNFFAVTVWFSSYTSLVSAMAPLQAQGVRFLTPADAFACLPPAPTTTTTTSMPPTSPSTTTTAPGGSVDPGGIPAIPAAPIGGVPTYTA